MKQGEKALMMAAWLEMGHHGGAEKQIAAQLREMHAQLESLKSRDFLAAPSGRQQDGEAQPGNAGEQTMTVQEVWEAAGCNPSISATKQDVLDQLRLMDEVCDETSDQDRKISSVFRVKYKNGETCHFGNYATAKAYSNGGEIEELPLRNLQLVSADAPFLDAMCDGQDACGVMLRAHSLCPAGLPYLKKMQWLCAYYELNRPKQTGLIAVGEIEAWPNDATPVGIVSSVDGQTLLGLGEGERVYVIKRQEGAQESTK